MTFSTDPITVPSARGPAFGLAAQLAVLAGLALTVGLTGAAWLAGAAYGLVLCGCFAAGLHRVAADRVGPANLVTLGRAVLVGGVTALVVTALQRPVPTALLVTVAAVALALDGVDGYVARRTGTSSALGARFDMEVDAFLILVLSVFAAGVFGWWTVAIGALRYAFVAASWALPWLTAPLPPRFSRKVVAAVQGVALVAAVSGLLPSALSAVAVAAALASLIWSFGRDVRWLHRHRTARAARARLRPVSRCPAPVG